MASHSGTGWILAGVLVAGSAFLALRQCPTQAPPAEGPDLGSGRAGSRARPAPVEDPTWRIVTVAGTRYRVRRAEWNRRGPRAVRRDLFLQHLRGLTAAGDPDPRDCLALARWAADKELPALYGLALRLTLMLDGEQKEARKRLSRLRARLSYLAPNPAAARRLLEDLGPSFQLLRTPHFRIAFQTSETFARDTGKLLERVHGAFFRFFRERFFEPVPPADRLEVVLFRTREGYRRFTTPYGRALRNTAGFYSSKDHRSYFFDAQGDADRVEVKRRLAEALKRLRDVERNLLDDAAPGQRFRVAGDGVPSRDVSGAEAKAILEKQQRRLKRLARKLTLRLRRLNVSRAVHEITHHLAYAAGIHSRYSTNPRWLVEGLAMYFEATVDGAWVGPGRLDKERLARVRKRSLADTGPALARIVEQDALFEEGDRRTGEAYDAAWALFYYLAQGRHDRLFDYLANLSLRVTDEPYGPRARRRDLERAFGPLPVLERAWRRFVEAPPPTDDGPTRP